MLRENFYILLDLSVAPPEKDPTKISAAIEKKQREWTRDKMQNPAKSAKAQAAMDLIPEMRKLLIDPELCDREAAEARTILAKQDKERFKELDSALKLITLKGYLTETELGKLLQKFSSIAEADVRKRIKVEIRSEPTKTPKTEVLDSSLAKEIRANLELLGKSSLYEFLDVSPTSSLKTLQAETCKRDAENKSVAKKDAKVTATGNLIGQCLKLFKSENERQKYDATRAREKLQTLDAQIDFAGMDQVIQAQEYDQLIRDAVKLGLTKDEAAEYIRERAHKRKYSLEMPQQLSVDLLKPCGQCGMLNQPLHKNCTSCGYLLEVECPKCKTKSPSSHRVCGQCGFALGDMPNALNLLARAKAALSRGESAEAKRLFTEAEHFWPGQAEITRQLSRMEARQKEEQALTEALNQAVAAKRFYEAQKQLAQLEAKNPKHPGLSQRARIHRAVQAAEEWVAKAKSESNSDRVLNCYLNALDEAEDCREAADGVAKSPLEPAGPLSASVSAQAIKLSWQASPSQKDICYLLVRSTHAQPNTPQDGEILTRTSQTLFDDTTAVPGKHYYYGVFTQRKSVSASRASVQGPVMRLAEVTHLQVMPGDGALTFQWKTPERAVEVHVWRKQGSAPARRGDGTRLAGIRCDGFTDTGLHNGTPYGYLICAAFRGGDGRLALTPGITKLTQAREPLTPVIDLSIQSRGSALDFKWTTPPNGAVSLYYSPKKPTGQEGDPLDAGQLGQLGTQVSVRRAGHARAELDIRGQCWVTPITFEGDAAVMGKSVSYTSIESVKNLRVQLSGGRIYLDWVWPKGAEQAAVAFRFDHFPHSPDEPGTTVHTVTCEQYQRQDGFLLSDFENRSHHFAVFVIAKSAEGILYSNGTTYLLGMGDLAEIYYEIKLKRNLFRKPKVGHLRLWSRQDHIAVPGIVLVAKPGKQPLHKKDGTSILTVPPNTTVGRSGLDLEIPCQFLQPNSYAKLFLEERADANTCRLMPPNKSKLQLY